MAAPRIKAVRMLKNHGVRVTTESTRHGVTHRFIRPGGALSTHEAAALLKTYPNMVTRMVRAGRMTGERDESGRLLVPVGECRRLLSLPAGQRLGATPVTPR